MENHTITLERHGVNGFLSGQTIGTDALNALNKIPGVTSSEIISETESQVQISFTWDGKGEFWRTSEVLSQQGLRRVDT